MNERYRLNLKAFKEEEAEREALEREQAERPIREAESALIETHRALHATIRERIATQKDDESWADPILAGTRMLKDEAQRYNGEQFAIFARDNPDAYLSEANRAAIVDYLVRNDIQISTAETYKRAYARLAEFGLLEDAPAPEPEPEPLPEPVAEPIPETFEGIDLSSGEPRTYTAYQVSKMGSEEYLRTFRLGRSYPSGAPTRGLAR